MRGLVCALIMGLMSSVVVAEETERYGQQKVVYDVSDPGGPDDKAYKVAMRNIQDHINAVGAGNMDIKVVLHGNGLGLLLSANTDDTIQTVVSQLKGQDVDFHV